MLFAVAGRTGKRPEVPFLEDLVLESTDVVESLFGDFNRSSAGVSGRSSCMEGSTNLFCLLGGRISSKSTGTPKLTRNNLRIRERVQLGGCMGGGETSCCQRERERSERKGVELAADKGRLADAGKSDRGALLGRIAVM